MYHPYRIEMSNSGDGSFLFEDTTTAATFFVAAVVFVLRQFDVSICRNIKALAGLRSQGF